MAEKQLVLVVDDEVKILEVVKSYLERSGYEALTAKNGIEALGLLHKNETLGRHVSLILLDLMLPDLDGEDLCKRVRAESDVPIIMMTAKVEERDIIHGLNLGADDYVTKPFSPRELMARVASVLRRSGGGRQERGGGLLCAGELEVDTENRRAVLAGNVLGLTANEYRILVLLMSRPHKIFTRDEIIENIKDDSYEGLDRAVDTHVKNLRRKLGDDPRSPEYIVTAYGMGYRFGGSERHGGRETATSKKFGHEVE
jgi:DNA-binding response OmpR family regulator